MTNATITRFVHELGRKRRIEAVTQIQNPAYADLVNFLKCFGVLIIGATFSSAALAGFTEVTASGNYRQTYINQTNYSTMQSISGSVAYYFWEMSALELSYTDGISRNITDEYTSAASFKLIGLDFVLSFGSKDAVFKPYIKVGGAYEKKQLTYRQPFQDTIVDNSEGPAPSLGIGFRLGFGESFAIKAGIEAWSSPLTANNNQPLTYDISGRAGISWLF